MAHLLPGRLLEIGPGSGHFLAAAVAAGRDVAAVETSAVNRKFISSTWGIGPLYPSTEQIPVNEHFDSVALFNVIEHIYDIDTFLRDLINHLSPGGRLFVSTVNSRALVARVLRTWWSMFKEEDHVSFPSATGLQALAQRGGLQTLKTWSTELPFETFVSVAVGVRDWLHERRPTDAASGSGCAVTGSDQTRTVLQRVYTSRAARLDPSSRLMSAAGVAGTVKGLFVRP